jgi:hypothetical protein
MNLLFFRRALSWSLLAALVSLPSLAEVRADDDAAATEGAAAGTEAGAVGSGSTEPAAATTPTPEEQIDEIARSVDADERAQEVSAGILQPIYLLAEKLAFPAFHWIAFAVMFAGVVSYALQLVLGKLIVLTRMSFSVSEILSDALGLVISVVGLVLTTQAAAENSTFTTSAASVLSASAAGLVIGFVFYLWGQSQELQAARGRSVEVRVEKK